MTGQIEKARQLRRDMSDAERTLWRVLRSKQLDDLKFRRQEPIGPYIADFVCLERRLVVELDGSQHSERIEQDRRRDEWLNSQGFRVLRFWNDELMQNRNGVIEKIRECCSSPSPSSPPIEGGETVAPSPFMGEG